MKKIIFKNGLLGGLVVSTTMIITTIFMKAYPDKEPSMVLGFLSMFLSFLFIIIGIKQQEASNKSGVSFWKSFKTGFYISAIISTIYVLVWLVIYYNFFPDFMDNYSNIVLKNAKPEELSAKTLEMEQMKVAYKNPIFVILYTYFEVFPLGILVALITPTVTLIKQKIGK
jgi:phosphatidylglycerophosphate synthase